MGIKTVKKLIKVTNSLNLQPYKNKICKKLLKAISLDNLQPYKAVKPEHKSSKKPKIMKV
jgi:hypothetical protein